MASSDKVVAVSAEMLEAALNPPPTRSADPFHGLKFPDEATEKAARKGYAACKTAAERAWYSRRLRGDDGSDAAEKAAATRAAAKEAAKKEAAKKEAAAKREAAKKDKAAAAKK